MAYISSDDFEKMCALDITYRVDTIALASTPIHDQCELAHKLGQLTTKNCPGDIVRANDSGDLEIDDALALANETVVLQFPTRPHHH